MDKKMNLYSIKDEASGDFAPPFAAVNDLVAVRSVRQQFDKVPDYVQADFFLYFLGTFDVNMGTIEVMTPKKIPVLMKPLSASDVKKKGV